MPTPTEPRAAEPRPGEPGPTERRVALGVSRRWPVISALGAVGLALLIGWLVTVRSTADLLDAEWMEEIVEHRSPIWQGPALVMNFIGGGWFGVFAVPIGIVVWLLITRHRAGALYFVMATILSAGVVQALKHTFGRARPADILVTSDFGSFPSGHVANAATMAVALGVIFGMRRVWIGGAVYAVVMLVSRTYLGAHWLTDTVGGLLVGGGVAVVLWAPFALRLLRERRRSASAGA
ncbi:undecaprenyl-diphosphatase [Frondihabitans sp. PhB188]|uniref:phosphatase PAP2 family protein n=1 Tax=Frondihabitans sp. PhB188 TaxID=2485200 RepID=UPI000F4AF3C1|nr:phosphatase PAP2 family protein [Frondihabitans sp. PhB188]ROQ36754.1 undecaprenyl-diphosphatase [Frondihabitans sp. PhB188]